MGFFCCLRPTDEDDKQFPYFPHGSEIPVKNRKQTDFPYFVTLVVLLTFLVISISVAVNQGGIRRLFQAYDDKGNLCGIKNEPIKGIEGTGLDLTEKKYLQTTKYCESDSDDCRIDKKCVEICGDEAGSYTTITCNVNYEMSLLGKLRPVLTLVYSDLSLCWIEIIVLCVCSISLTVLIMIALRMFAKIVVRAMIILISLAAVGGTAFAWIAALVKAVAVHTADEQPLKEVMKMDIYNCVYIGVILSIFTGLFFFLYSIVRNKLPVISVLFEEGGKCIKDIPTMLLQPILTHLIIALFACFLLTGVICFRTSGKAEIDDNGKVYFPVNIFFQIASWCLIFAFLWLSLFLLACQNNVLAGAASSWYFSSDCDSRDEFQGRIPATVRLKGILTDPVCRSFCTLVKHHLGCSALGSLLFAIIKTIAIISIIITLIILNNRSYNSIFAAIICGIMKCILVCVLFGLKILNKSAYIMIVLFGEKFCSSARKAFACLTSDSSKISLIIGVGTIILAAIEVLIAATVTIIGIAIFKTIEGIKIIWIPAIVLFFISYLCCQYFISVYKMTIHTLILCFCVDHQMNNGEEKPYNIYKNLMILLNQEESEYANPNEDGDQKMLVCQSSLKKEENKKTPFVIYGGAYKSEITV